MFICSFSLLEIKKSCSKLENVIFLIKISYVSYLPDICFSSFCWSDHVSEISFFSYGFLWEGNYCQYFCVSRFHFYCHYYFSYDCFLGYKKPPFDLCQPSTKNQVTLSNNGSLSEHSWRTSTKTRGKNWRVKA